MVQIIIISFFTALFLAHILLIPSLLQLELSDIFVKFFVAIHFLSIALMTMSFLFIIPFLISSLTSKNKKHMQITVFLTVFSITLFIITYINIIKTASSGQ